MLALAIDVRIVTYPEFYRSTSTKLKIFKQMCEELF